MATILIVVAHTDDEVFGMAGTLARHVSFGDEVYAISMTDGVSSRLNSNHEFEISRRKACSEAAASLLGFKWLAQGMFRDNSLDGYELLEIIQFIESATKNICPDIIYTHSGADLNVDHRLVNQACLTAFRFRANVSYCQIRTFEVLSSTDLRFNQSCDHFSPNHFVDITEFWNKKIEAINCYVDEIQPLPESRNVETLKALCRIRGGSVGLLLAEAFQIVLSVER